MNNELREFWEEKTRKAVEKAERSKALKTAKRMLASNKYSLEEMSLLKFFCKFPRICGIIE